MKSRLTSEKALLVLLLLAVIPTFVSLLRPGYFPMHDDIQGMRLLQMHKCFLDLQLPCRWVPDMGYGYGYPQFNFYGPLPYYILEPLVLLGTSILESVKVGFILSIIFSAYGMYKLGSVLWGKMGGVVSALFYSYAPYHAVDLYVRGAVGEFWALVFLPYIFYLTVLILTGRSREKTILLLALSFAGLFLTHNITSLMLVPFYGAFVIFFKKPEIKNLRQLVISGVWGIGLSAFFLLPAFLEKNYVHVETILQGYFNYLAHFVGFRQLLFSTYWGYGVSTLGSLDGMSLTLGLFHWSVPLLSLILLVYLKKNDKARKTFLLLVLGTLALFMAHPKSQFVWDNVFILSYIQFPWRFLAIAIFCFSAAAGSISATLAERKDKALLIITLFIALLMLYGSYFKPSVWLNITDVDKFSGENWRLQQTISIFDYLPIYAKHPPASAAPDQPIALDSTIEIVDSEKGTNWQTWQVTAHSDTKVELPIFDFPGWQVKVDGRSSFIDNNNELGLISVSVPEGVHKIEARLYDTNIRLFSNILSVVSILGIIPFLKFYDKRVVKR